MDVKPDQTDAAGDAGRARLPESGSLVAGRVVRFTDNGSAMVRLPQGMLALLPAHEYSWVDERIDLSKWLKRGQDVDVVVRKVKPMPNSGTFITVSHRRTKPDPWASMEVEHPVGSRAWGCVRKIGAKSGVFIELETGYRAMVHRSELSWTSRAAAAATMFEVGQWIEVVIVSIDAEKRRIAASYRQTLENPWAKVEGLHPIGSKATATVKVLARTYMLVELETGHVAVVESKEMAWSRLTADPRMIFAQGQRIEVVILGIDAERRRIEASYRQATDSPWPGFAERFPVGTELTATVANVEKFGAFVKLADGCEGLLHRTGMLEPTASPNVGETVRVRVADFDAANRRVRLVELGNDNEMGMGQANRLAA